MAMPLAVRYSPDSAVGLAVVTAISSGASWMGIYKLDVDNVEEHTHEEKDWSKIHREAPMCRTFGVHRVFKHALV
jgi:hypothetical protein